MLFQDPPRRRSVRAALLTVGWIVWLTSFDRFAYAATLGDAVVISFDNVGLTGNPVLTSLVVGEYSFTSDRFHTVADPTGAVVPLVDNGSIYVAQEGGGLGQPITLRRVDGQPFALLRLDAAEGFTDELTAASLGYASAEAIRALAMLPDGGSTAGSLVLDGLRDGPGGIADFQSFDLPPAFCNVTSVTFSGSPVGGIDGAIALDNLVVAAVVPEPTGMSLAVVAVVAALGAWTVRRRWQRRARW
jgi:hypothetical protein